MHTTRPSNGPSNNPSRPPRHPSGPPVPPHRAPRVVRQAAVSTGRKTPPIARFLAGPLLALIGCAPSYPNVVDCEDTGEIHVICGLQNPEDLALLPGDREVVLSQFGSMDGSKSGSLAFFDLETEAVRVAFEGGPGPTPAADTDVWGDPGCPGPPAARFSPHGIDLAELPNHELRLLVVNHGDREAVEFFEVRPDPTGAALVWRGCAVAPEQAFLNDVVSLPSGGFLVTHMMPRDDAIWGILKSSLGFDTGHVYAWQPGQGFNIAAGTHGPFPNGIEISPDGTHIYLNLYGSGEVRKIDRRTGEILGSAQVASPDNAAWGRDGRLLVASHGGGLSDQLACMTLDHGACGMQFSVVAVDPVSMETESIFSQAGPPMGAGTVALDLGDGELLIGSFAADRMIRVRVPR